MYYNFCLTRCVDWLYIYHAVRVSLFLPLGICLRWLPIFGPVVLVLWFSTNIQKLKQNRTHGEYTSLMKIEWYQSVRASLGYSFLFMIYFWFIVKMFWMHFNSCRPDIRLSLQIVGKSYPSHWWHALALRTDARQQVSYSHMYLHVCTNNSWHGISNIFLTITNRM